MRFRQPTTVERGVVPDGKNVCTITAAREREINGRTVLILTFTPEDEGNLPFDKFLDPNDDRDLVTASQITAALGLDPDEDLCDRTIGGARVVVETKIARNSDGSEKTNKSGNVIVYVNGVSAVATTGTRPGGPKPRTPAAAVAKARGDEPGGDTDVPF